MHPLHTASQRFREEAKTGRLVDEWRADGQGNVHLAELELVDANLEKVTRAVAALN